MPNNKLPIDLLIFDFDGTLTDSIPAAVESIQKMISDLKLPYKSKEEINMHVGYGEIPLVQGAIGSSDPDLLHSALETYFMHYEKDGINKVQLFPHVKEILEYFKDKAKIIISNKKHDFIGKILSNLNLTHYFEEYMGGDTAPCLKPDPCAINGVILKYNVNKDKALFVGDMTIDIETGKNADIKTCAVTYGFDPKIKLLEAKPDLLVDDLLELKELII